MVATERSIRAVAKERPLMWIAGASIMMIMPALVSMMLDASTGIPHHICRPCCYGCQWTAHNIILRRPANMMLVAGAGIMPMSANTMIMMLRPAINIIFADLVANS